MCRPSIVSDPATDVERPKMAEQSERHASTRKGQSLLYKPDSQLAL